MDVELRISWYIGHDQSVLLEEKMFSLLQAIEETGSLGRAAHRVSISYRSAWNLLQDWSARMGRPLVNLQRGRGSTLSMLGRNLLAARNQVEDEFKPLLKDTAKTIGHQLDRPSMADASAMLRMTASHCFSHSLMKSVFKEQGSPELMIRIAGSRRSLATLLNDECDVAGFHLADGDLRREFIRPYRDVLDVDNTMLVFATKRRQGLIVTAGNPHKITALHQLTHNNICFVNRQENSGTRMLFDILLSHEGIDGSRINGYEHVEFTHSAVAALVASGSADVAMATAESARQMGLEFIPLATESYYYAFKKNSIRANQINAFVTLIGGKTFRETLRALAGYDSRDSGKLLSATEIF